MRVKDITLSVKCLPYQHENLSSEPQHPRESWVWWHASVIPPLGDAETGGSLVWNDIYLVTSGSEENHGSKSKVEEWGWRWLSGHWQLLLFQGTQVLFLALCWMLITVYNSSFGEFSALFWPLWAPAHILCVHTCACMHTHTHTHK